MKTNTAQKRSIELVLLFIFYPIFLAIDVVSLKIRLSFVPFLLIYIAAISYQNRNNLLKKRKQIKPNKFWIQTIIRLFIIAIATTLYVLYKDNTLLFSPILEQPLLWIKMIFIYTFFSVLPQEYLYRVFYFKRYQSLFKNKNTLFITNALVFSLAHLMFHSILILLITLIGGYIFALTYNKTKSWLWVCIEHAIYGSWLFTVGMGTMLGFPI